MSAMELHLHNSAVRCKERFEPIDPGHVRIYVCGPTVYDLAHLGNARPNVVFDVLVRLLRTLYPRVTYARNITDVDDKIIDRARESGEGIDQLTARTTADFHRDMAALNCLPPDVEPTATGHIAEMIALTEKLIARGHAYAAEGHVLFSVGSFADYGKLSGRNQDELLAGARVDVAPYKRDPGDFVLWKPSDADTPGWDSPWGRGRPGWHIECSAMSWRHLGETFDIHGGGHDLLFPHHENEVAQSRAAFGTPFMAHTWLHNGMLLVDGEKMSKSLGNVVTIRKFIEKYSGQVLRQLLLSVHYRAKLDWTDEAIERALQDVQRIHEFALELAQRRGSPAPADAKVQELVTKFKESFRNELANDFNSAGALGQFFSFLRDVRRDHFSSLELSDGSLALIRDAVAFANLALGHIHPEPAQLLKQLESLKGAGNVDEAWIQGLIEERRQAKASKDWARADQIRDELKAKSIVLVDNKDGSVGWKML